MHVTGYVRLVGIVSRYVLGGRLDFDSQLRQVLFSSLPHPHWFAVSASFLSSGYREICPRE